MATEKRKFLRVRLSISARGVIRSGTEFFQFVGKVVNLSEGGVGISLTIDSTNRLKEKLDQGMTVDDVEVMMQLISYIEENIPVTGAIAQLDTSGEKVFIGVEFNSLGKKGSALLGKILEMAPYLRNAKPGDEKTSVTKFANFNEFIEEMTELIILSEKKGYFYIGKERFAFTGMHKDDLEELHVDCIESMDRPGTVLCPDCRTQIETIDLI